MNTFFKLFANKKEQKQQNSWQGLHNASGLTSNLSGMLGFQKNHTKDEPIDYPTFTYYYNNVAPLRNGIQAIISAVLSFEFLFKKNDDVVDEKNGSLEASTIQMLEQAIFKTENNLYCTNWNDIVNSYYVSYFAGQIFINVVLDAQKQEILRFDIVPANLLTVQTDVDGFIKSITKDAQQGQALSKIYVRNTQLFEKPQFFQVKKQDTDYPEFMFAFINKSFYEGLLTTTGVVGMGVSRMQPIKPQIDIYDILQKQYHNYLQNGLHLAGFFMPNDGNMDDQAKASIDASIANYRGVDKAGKVGVLTHNMDFIDILKDADKYNPTEKMKEVAMLIYQYIGTPASWFDNKSTQFANQQQENKRFYTVIIPQLIKNLLQDFNYTLQMVLPILKDINIAIDVDYESNTFVAELKIEEAMKLYDKGSGIITKNEARAKLSYEKLTIEDLQEDMATQSIQNLYKEIDEEDAGE